MLEKTVLGAFAPKRDEITYTIGHLFTYHEVLLQAVNGKTILRDVLLAAFTGLYLSAGNKFIWQIGNTAPRYMKHR
jgi:hypothetical protein